ncbi:MAG: cytochrome c1 [Gallionella sp.]|nr:cytochrome c1 [Gallionella sp.]
MSKLIALLLLLATFFSTFAFASASEEKLEKFQVDTSVVAVERGVDAFMNACHSCHSLKYVHYRDLVSYGINKVKIAEWRGDSTLDSAMTSLISDEGAIQSFGTIPPDMSMIVRAREGGNSYLYSYLTGYYLTPEGTTANHFFPLTKMPDALGVSNASNPTELSELHGKAHDVVSFLAWASDPHEAERESLGYYVIAYLIVLTLLLYNLKVEIWSELK